MSDSTTPTTPAMPAPVLQPPTEAVAIVQMIERAARDPSIDIARMQELIAMREQMRLREAAIAFDEAMTLVQGEMRAVVKDSENAQTRSTYESYYALDRELRPIYTKHGLSLSFNTAPGLTENSIRVLCRVAKGGYGRDYQLDMPADGKGARGSEVMTRTHATGSATTYGRRYLLKMIFNIAIKGDKDDDDGVDAGRVERKPPQPAPNVIAPYLMQRAADPAAMPAAATAPPTIQPPEQGGAVPKPTIEDMARAAARKGDEAFRAFYRLRSAEERYKLSFIGGELRALIINATVIP